MDEKLTILIIDDAMINREILKEILEDEYNILEAESGEEGIEILKAKKEEIGLVLLDIIMPGLDGFDVLAVMNSRHWIDDVPVIMISSETSPARIAKAYELGASDYVTRPYDSAVVHRRVQNTIMLYAKQKRLLGLVASQIFEKEKNNSMMVSILSHIVEFRNGESGLHVMHINTLTELLLNALISRTDDYRLTKQDVSTICMASSLHDIGKINIPDEILNKPGRFTDEEYAIMKTHSSTGAEMLDNLPFYGDEPLVRYAKEICRWHHERYDGSGYPDGLKGEEIPIAAQVVAMADVYDALTSERVYKKSFSHEEAINMIIRGECGAFSPLMYQCLKDIAHLAPNEMDSSAHYLSSERRVRQMTSLALESEGLL